MFAKVFAICVLSISCLVAPIWGGEIPSGEVWMLRQDFVKFGKKEVYEGYQKEFLEGLGKYAKKGVFSTFAIQVLDSPEYLYWTSLGSYAGLEAYLKQMRGYQATFSSEEWDQKMLARASTINFFLTSLQVYLPECSSLPKGNGGLLSQPYTSYSVVGIAPGQEGSFEGHLQGMVASEKESSASWRVWRVVVGSDQPKYLIAVFGDSQEEAEKSAQKLEFVSGGMKQLLRKEKRGVGMARPDLSLVGVK